MGVRTTHAGSLPRPDDLVIMMQGKIRGELVDGDILQARIEGAVRDTVARQRALGIDIVSDGEMSKDAFHTYVHERIEGFAASDDRRFEPADIIAFPGLSEDLAAWGVDEMMSLRCTGPLRYIGANALATDLATLRAAVGSDGQTDAFVCAVSPGTVALNSPNEYYASYEEYVHAIAAALATEYRAIIHGGFILQLDAPDLAMAAHVRIHGVTVPAFREHLRIALEAIDEATTGLPPERMRLHLCWGNYAGPHHKDLPIAELLPHVLQARPAGLSFEAANPRHGHEWEAFTNVRIPEEKVLIPGVIDNTAVHIEHPRLVAQRVGRFAEIVGRERVIAGTDCGFSTLVGLLNVHPEVAWAKLGALVEGAAMV